MRIVDFRPDNETAVRQAARLLVEGFGLHWPDAWPTMDAARKEVRDSFEPGRISRVALDANGDVLGWIGGISGYGGNVWELHPLVVDPAQQRKGIGRALVQDLENQVAERGALTIRLGTDDEDDMTTLAGVDLYPDVLAHLRAIRNLKAHPYEFYHKLGFVITGVVPDANGLDNPDIYMAKRVAKRQPRP